MHCIELVTFDFYFMIKTIFTFWILWNSITMFRRWFYNGWKKHTFSNYRQKGVNSDKPFLLTLFVSLLHNYWTILKFKYASPFLLTTIKRLRYIELFWFKQHQFWKLDEALSLVNIKNIMTLFLHYQSLYTIIYLYIASTATLKGSIDKNILMQQP